MPAPSALGLQLEHTFSLDPSLRVHEIGHADYMLRYKTDTGIAFAVGRTTKTGARVWIPCDERWKTALTANGFDCVERDCASDGKGRIITLQAMPEFAGKRAYSIHVKTVGKAVAVVGLLR